MAASMLVSPQDAQAADAVAILSGAGSVSPQDAAAAAAVRRAGAKGGVFDTANTANGCSKLGQRTYWNATYAADLQAFNMRDSHAKEVVADADARNEEGRCDVAKGAAAEGEGLGERTLKRQVKVDDAHSGGGGEIWYGVDVTDNMVDLVTPFCTAGARVLDVGTGNGDLLARLSASGATSALAFFLGTDYCFDAVQLAQGLVLRRQRDRQHVTQKQGEGGQEANLGAAAAGFGCCEFLVDDILHTSLGGASAGGNFDVIMDKGTLDALSCKFDDLRGTRLVQQYLATLAGLGTPGRAVFVLTSANFTRMELCGVLGAAGWEYVQHVPYPRFSFGGGSGTHVNTTLYRLRDESQRRGRAPDRLDIR